MDDNSTINVRMLLDASHLAVKCPYCGQEMQRHSIDDHVRSHSQGYSLVGGTEEARRGRIVKRFFFNPALLEEKRVEIERGDASKKPILFTDPVYFDEALSILHQMRRPLFTKFTAENSELDSLKLEWRPLFKLTRLIPGVGYGSGTFVWRCPLCTFKTQKYGEALQTIFLALCHLLGKMRGTGVKGEEGKVEPLLGDEDLSTAVQDEWLNFNHCAGTNFHKASAQLPDFPIRIFDDYLPRDECDKSFIRYFFNRSHEGLARKCSESSAYFCSPCLRLFDSPSSFVGHMDVVHSLRMELRLFPVNVLERAIGEELCDLTPCWFPLVVRLLPPQGVGFQSSVFRWDCFQCDRVRVESTDLLLVLVKALLHLYFEAYSIYANLSSSWPALVEFCAHVSEKLRLEGYPTSIDSAGPTLSIPVRLILPLVHGSAVPHFPADLQKAFASSSSCAAPAATQQSHKIKHLSEAMVKKLAAQRLEAGRAEPCVHYCLQCELYLGGSLGHHRCCKKEEKKEEEEWEGRVESHIEEKRDSLAYLLRKIHLSVAAPLNSTGTTGLLRRDYESEDGGAAVAGRVRRANLKRKRVP